MKPKRPPDVLPEGIRGLDPARRKSNSGNMIPHERRSRRSRIAAEMRCLLLNKPFQVLSRFTDEKSRTTLHRFVRLKNVYPAGRLDYDSEGLLFLTDDGDLQSRLSNPRYRLRKVYWAQVEGAPQLRAVQRL